MSHPPPSSTHSSAPARRPNAPAPAASASSATRNQIPAAASRANGVAAAAASSVRTSAGVKPRSTMSTASSAPSSARMGRATAAPSAAVSRIKRAAAAASSSSSLDSLTPPALESPIPLHISSDPLSRCTPPLLHLISTFLSVSELCSWSRVNRIQFTVLTAQDPVWKGRWKTMQLAGVGAKQVAAGPVAKHQRAPGARPVLPGRRPAASSGSAGSASAKSALSKPAAAAAGLASSMVPSALSHAVAEAAAVSLLPPSLPVPSPYRHMVLHALRGDSERRFNSWAQRSPQAILVHKPLVEQLLIRSMQLRIGVAKSPVLSGVIPVNLGDSALTAGFRPGPGVDLNKLRDFSVLLFSGKLMRAIPVASAPAKHEREWGVLKAGRGEGEVSLVEWRIKGSNAPAVQLEPASDSPFAPNAANRARSLAAAAAAASSKPTHDGSLPIPGLHLRILAGVYGTWSPNPSLPSDVAFISLSIPYPLLLASIPTLPWTLRQPRWVVQPDDLDSRLGMQGYRVQVSLREMRRPIWSWSFCDINAQLDRRAAAPSGSSGTGEIRLKFPALNSLAPAWSQLPCLPWKGQLFSGKFESMLIVDLLLATDSGRLVWVVSTPVKLECKERDVGACMDEPQAQLFVGEFKEKDVGSFRVEMLHSPAILASADGRRVSSAPLGPGHTKLQSMSLALDVAFIDTRFGTTYAKTGCANLSAALQSRARTDMSEQEYAEFQHSQLALRRSAEEERPLGTRAAAAAAGRGNAARVPAPNFTVHAAAAAPPPAGAGRGARGAAAGAGAGARARTPAARPQWQNSVEQKDEEEGFKF